MEWIYIVLVLAFSFSDKNSNYGMVWFTFGDFSVCTKCHRKKV